MVKRCAALVNNRRLIGQLYGENEQALVAWVCGGRGGVIILVFRLYLFGLVFRLHMLVHSRRRREERPMPSCRTVNETPQS